MENHIARMLTPPRPQKVELVPFDRAGSVFDRVRFDLQMVKKGMKEGYDYEILFNHFGHIYAVSKFGPRPGDVMEIEVYNQDEESVTICYIPIEQANLMIHVFKKSRPQAPRRFIGFITPDATSEDL